MELLSDFINGVAWYIAYGIFFWGALIILGPLAKFLIYIPYGILIGTDKLLSKLPEPLSVLAYILIFLGLIWVVGSCTVHALF
jgi:hypothetical protein